jgi:hypothetical protein
VGVPDVRLFVRGDAWFFAERRDLPGRRRWWALWRQGRGERFD